MHEFKHIQDLLDQHKGRFSGKVAATKFSEVLEGGTQLLNAHVPQIVASPSWFYLWNIAESLDII